eukprot:1064756-Prymnesium_polylepis.1
MSVRYRKSPSLLAHGSGEPTSVDASLADEDKSKYVAERYDQSLRTMLAREAHAAIMADKFKKRLCTAIKGDTAASTPDLATTVATFAG